MAVLKKEAFTGTPEEHFQERLSFMKIDGSVRESLAIIKPIVEESLPGILDSFYATVRQWPNLNAFFSNAAHMEAAKNLQMKHWSTILEGRFDSEYIASIKKIGMTHNRIGLEPRWYIGGYSAIVGGVMAAVSQKLILSGLMTSKKREMYDRAVAAFLKAVLLDMDMAISTYFEAGKEEYSGMLLSVTNDFDRNIVSFIGGLMASTSDLQKTAVEMKHVADVGQKKADSLQVSAASAMENVNTVASASEEMLASIQEINTQISKSSAISKEAVMQMRQAAEAIAQ